MTEIDEPAQQAEEESKLAASAATAEKICTTLKVVDFEAEQKDVILSKLASQNKKKRRKLIKKKEAIEAQIAQTKRPSRDQ